MRFVRFDSLFCRFRMKIVDNDDPFASVAPAQQPVKGSDAEDDDDEEGEAVIDFLPLLFKYIRTLIFYTACFHLGPPPLTLLYKFQDKPQVKLLDCDTEELRMMGRFKADAFKPIGEEKNGTSFDYGHITSSLTS